MKREQGSSEAPEAAGASMGRYAGLGLQLAMSVALFLAVGWWADGRLGTTPLLTIVGAMGGGGAGFYSLYYHLVIEPRRKGGP